MAVIKGIGIGFALAVLATGGLVGCSSDSDDTAESVPTTAATESGTDDGSAGSTGFGGSAEVAFNGQTESFELVNCVSGTETSVQGSGSNDAYSLLIDVQEGSGDVVLSNESDMSVYLDGDTSDLAVAEDGSFTATGTGVADFAEVSFELSGTCEALNWLQ